MTPKEYTDYRLMLSSAYQRQLSNIKDSHTRASLNKGNTSLLREIRLYRVSLHINKKHILTLIEQSL